MILHAELISQNLLTGKRIYIVRHIPSGGFGEPFTWSFTLIRPHYFAGTAIIKNLTGEAFTRSGWQAIKDLLVDMGFTQAVAQRRGKWICYLLSI